MKVLKTTRALIALLLALAPGVSGCDDGGSSDAGGPTIAPAPSAPQTGEASSADPSAPSAAPLDAERFVDLYAEVECARARATDQAGRDAAALDVLSRRGVDFAAYVRARARFGGPDAEAAKRACLPAVATPAHAPDDDRLVAIQSALNAIAAREELAPADRPSLEEKVFSDHGLTRESWQMAVAARQDDPAFRERIANPPLAEPVPDDGEPVDLTNLPPLGPEFDRLLSLSIARTCVLAQGWPKKRTEEWLDGLHEGYGFTRSEFQDALARYGDDPRYLRHFRAVTRSCTEADYAIPPEPYAPLPADQ